MITKRFAEHRGHATHGWLDTWHTFSFATYFDRNHMHHSALRVINDDIIAGGGGFPTHPHDNMEIITYMLSGALLHRDSMGHESVLLPGDVQVMSAGRGLTHSEFNASKDTPLHLLQIWIFPDQQDVTPRYDQKHFTPEQKRDTLCQLAGRFGTEGVLNIHQDASVYASILSAGSKIQYQISEGRTLWLHGVSGEVSVNGTPLAEGDGVAVTNEVQILLSGGVSGGEFLLFDLPADWKK